MITNLQNAMLTKRLRCVKCNREFHQIYLTYMGNKFQCSCGCRLLAAKSPESFPTQKGVIANEGSVD